MNQTLDRRRHAVEFIGTCFAYPQSDWPGLHQIDLRIESGSVVVMTGSNGVGKSTVLKLISGALTPTEGRVLVGGRRAGFDGRVAHMDRSDSTDWSFPIDVRRFVLLGRYVHRGPMRPFRESDHRRVDETLDLLQLTQVKHRQIGELSSGQQQRAVIGRAVAQDADVYLFDEPLNSLDGASARIFSNVVERLKAADRTVIVVTHEQGRLKVQVDRTLDVADNPRALARSDR